VFEKRVTVFVGHFGSGKTEIALNGALDLAAAGEEVTLADLDVVKPYFRSRSARALLADAGVRLLAPAGESIHSDLPIIVPEIRNLVRDSGRRLILDVGGDDTGARVLGSIADVIPSADTDCLVVLNFSRPFTRDAAEAETMVRAIERVGRSSVTGLVSNTHLMDETTADDVREGYRLARETAERVGVPVVLLATTAEVRRELNGEPVGCPVMVLRRIVRPPFEQPRGRSTGPLFVVN
jgi:hypothetical protein